MSTERCFWFILNLRKNIKRSKYLSAGILAAALFSTGSQAQSTDCPAAKDMELRLQPENVKKILQSLVDAKKTVGAVVGLVTPKGVCFITAGQSGVKAAPALKPDSIFEMASVTKVYTGTLLADMVIKGELKLTDPIGPYLPKPLADNPSLAAVTFKQLTTHTSGLARIPLVDLNFIKSGATSPDNPYANYTYEQFLNYLKEVKLKPTTTMEYSNTGIALLGIVLGQKAGKSYEQLLNERLLLPLKMSDTGLSIAPAAMSRAVQEHTPDGQPTPMWTLNFFAPMGGLRSTANDQIKVLQAILRQDEPWRTAQQQIMPVGKVGGIGYNWMMARLIDGLGKTDTMVWHNGATFGVSTFLGTDVARGFGVVVLLNTGELNLADSIGLHLWDARIPAPKAK